MYTGPTLAATISSIRLPVPARYTSTCVRDAKAFRCLESYVVVMWEMQQLGRRAGALDVDLISSRLGEMTLLSSSAQGLDEREHGQCSRAAPHRLA